MCYGTQLTSNKTVTIFLAIVLAVDRKFFILHFHTCMEGMMESVIKSDLFSTFRSFPVFQQLFIMLVYFFFLIISSSESDDEREVVKTSAERAHSSTRKIEKVRAQPREPRDSRGV